MRILRIRLESFRGTREREVHFGPGVTVVEGPNEIGKSSLAEALDLIFAYKDSSSAKPVKAVFPVDRDASPEIEVELETGPYALVYRKRFGKGARTELQVTRPRPESATGVEAHERVEAILAETLDAELWKALRIEQGAGLAQASLADSRALGRALDRASGGASEREGDPALFERAREEYERYFTATGKEKAEFGERRAGVREHEARVAELEQRHAELETGIEELAKLSTRQRAVGERMPAEQAEQKRRTEEWERVETTRLALVREESEVGRARLAAESAGRAEAAREDLRRRLALQRAAVLGLEQRAADPTLSSAAARTRLEAAKARVDEATSAAEQARAAAELCRADFDFRRTELEGVQLDERLARVLVQRDKAAEAERVLAGHRVTDAALEEMRQAERSVHQAKARLETGAPRLEARALAAITFEVDGETLALAAGAEAARLVTRPTLLRFADGLEIRVRPGTSIDELEQALALAERAYAEACERSGMASAAAAAAAHTARKLAESDLGAAHDSIRADLRDLRLGELEAKRDRSQAEARAYLAERAPEPALPPDLDAAKAALERTKRQQDAAEAALERVLAAYEPVRTGFEALATEAARLAGQLDESRANCLDLEAELEAARRASDDEALARAQREAAQQAETAAQRLAQLRRDLDAQHPERAAALKGAAQAALDALVRESHELEVRVAGARARLDSQQEAGLFEALERERARLEHAAAALRALERRAAAARGLFDALRRHRDAAQRAYRAPLASAIERLGRIVFGASFGVSLGSDLRIESRTLEGRTVPFESLSAGAREQVGMLARLAAARVVAGDDGVPLILDDALGHSDPDRLAAMAAAIGCGPAECQVIVLTCYPDRFRGIPGARVERLSAA